MQVTGFLCTQNTSLDGRVKVHGGKTFIQSHYFIKAAILSSTKSILLWVQTAFLWSFYIYTFCPVNLIITRTFQFCCLNAMSHNICNSGITDTKNDL